MNLRILEFAGKQVLSGYVKAVSSPYPAGNSIQVIARIENKAYESGKMTDTSVDIVFVDNAKYKLATWIQSRVGSRICILTMLHNDRLYALKVSDEKSLVWTLSDGENERNVIYGSVRLEQMDEMERYARVVTTVNGLDYLTTFWNNAGSPLGERIKQVFGNINARQTFIVAGEKRLFRGKPSMRGFWFICD